MELIGAFAAAVAMGSLILALAPQLGRQLRVPDGRRSRPPGPPEHVVPVRVAEEQRDRARRGLTHRCTEVVQLGGQHSRIHEHRVRAIQQQRTVHPEHTALPHADAATEISPRAHRQLSGRRPRRAWPT